MSVQDAGYLSRFGESLSRRWLLGRQLADLDDWPSQDTMLAEHGPDHEHEQILYRLNWSIKWHTLANLQAMRWYTGLKVVQILAAAAIPVLTLTGGDSFATKGWVAALGALIVVLEGVQQLKKYGQNGLLWAQGKEALKREYYLFEARVSPYDAADRWQRLANRIEQLIGKEVGKWADRQDDDDVANEVAHQRSRPAVEATQRYPAGS